MLVKQIQWNGGKHRRSKGPGARRSLREVKNHRQLSKFRAMNGKPGQGSFGPTFPAPPSQADPDSSARKAEWSLLGHRSLGPGDAVRPW